MRRTKLEIQELELRMQRLSEELERARLDGRRSYIPPSPRPRKYEPHADPLLSDQDRTESPPRAAQYIKPVFSHKRFYARDSVDSDREPPSISSVVATSSRIPLAGGQLHQASGTTATESAVRELPSRGPKRLQRRIPKPQMPARKPVPPTRRVDSGNTIPLKPQAADSRPSAVDPQPSEVARLRQKQSSRSMKGGQSLVTAVLAPRSIGQAH